LEIEEGYLETLQKLHSSGFAAAKKSENQLKILCNENFIELAKSSCLDVPKIVGINESIAEILLKNKDTMKKGLVEGLIITYQDERSEFRTVKWKGAHELQSTSEEKALEAFMMIQEATVHEDLRSAFACISEVITDTSENKYLTENMKTDRRGKCSNKKEKKTQKGNSKALSSDDRAIILDGITHCQKKFDSVEDYAKKDQAYLDDYIKHLVREVRIHLAEEKGDFNNVDDDDGIMGFIRCKVKETIKSQINF